MHALVAAFLVPLTAVLLIFGGADTDGDGVLDDADRCTVRSGEAQHLGCPFPVALDRKITRPAKQRTIRITDWRPWSSPTYQQIVWLDRSEARRWQSPSLLNRIACESTFNPGATNGQYGGLLQFGTIWSSMWAGTPRKMKLRVKATKRLPVIRHTRWSSGRWTHRTIGHRKQRRVVIRIGKLPRDASPYHGAAAIRVGSRAVSSTGRYPTTSWACGL